MSSRPASSNFGPRFYRRSIDFKLAIAAAIAGILGTVAHFLVPPPEQAAGRSEPSLGLIVAALGAGIIGAAVLLNFLWGLTSHGRYYAACLAAFIIGAPIAFALPRRYDLWASLIVFAGAVLLFFYVLGLSLYAGSGGIKRVRRYPIPASREIPWERAEIIRTDLRQITTFTRLGGRFGESENRLVVIGNGTRIVFSTTRFEAVRRDLANQVEHARPFIVAATLRAIDSKGIIHLGPIDIGRDAIVIKGYSMRPRRRLSLLGRIFHKPIHVAPRQGVKTSFEKGNLVLVSGRKYFIPLRLVPNGPYIPDILAALQ
jgi:hypothetical protein